MPETPDGSNNLTSSERPGGEPSSPGPLTSAGEPRVPHMPLNDQNNERDEIAEREAAMLADGGRPTFDFKVPGISAAEFEAAAGHEDGSANDAARKEEAGLEAGLDRDELAEQAAQSEHKRTERFRDHFERLAIFALWLFAIAIAGIAGVWLLHMILPRNYRWLTTEDLSHIQSIVTAGLLVGVVGNHFKKRLG